MRLFASLFGIGYFAIAPGTWGSAAALGLAWLILWLGGPVVFAAALVVVLVLGWVAAGAEIAASGDTDPAHVVIDEVAGQWIALLPVVLGAAHAGVAPGRLWPGWIAAFLLFRLFDIWKPGPVGWADRQGGAFGVMLDDVIAGLFAAIGVALLAALYHGLMLR